MKKIWRKSFIFKLIIAILSCIFFVFIFAIKLTIPFKPSFYSYSSYADARTIKDINKKYTYKEYGTVSDFEYAFENNKAIAGVTSDYTIISLINEGKIIPISKMISEMNGLLNPWESYFADSVKIQMRSFDDLITEKAQEKFRDEYPEYGTNYIFKFSDFIVPYFINDKVIAYDTNKIFGKLNMNQDPFNFIQAPSLVEALNKLSTQASNFKIQWTKNERENVVMGSTINNPKENWNTTIDMNNYLEMLNNFTTMVKEGTGSLISNTSVNIFDEDSDIILNNLINPTSKIKTAVIYNGDALDAYYGHDNFHEVKDGDRLRIIRTSYTVRVLDAFVVSASINEKETKDLLEDFNQTLFNGMFWSEEEIAIKASQVENIYDTEGIIRIFDYVNYTPAAKGLYEYVYNNYFLDEKGEQDEIARDIYKVATTDLSKNLFVKELAPIKKEILSKLAIEFQRKLNGF